MANPKMTWFPRWRRACLCLQLWMLAASLQLAGANVSIEGLSGAPRDNVFALLELAREACEIPDWRLRRLYDEAPEQIRDALEVYGFYSPRIEASLQTGDSCWNASFNVDAGAPVLLREINIEILGAGADREAWQKLLAGNPLVRGEPFEHARYESYKRRFDRLANRRGYFDAAYTVSRVDVYPEKNAADVTLVYQTGERYRFGEVRFDQDVVAAELIERFVAFESGEYYEDTLVTDLYQELQFTGFFELVEVSNAPRPAPELLVDLNVRLTAAPPQTFTAGVGFGTDTGVKLRAGYINRLINRDGHQWEADFSVSRVIQEVGASYRVPLEDPRSEWLNFDVGYKREDNDTSQNEIFKIGVKQLKRRRRGWLETRFLDLGYEVYEVGLDEGEVFLPIPGISWTHTDLGASARPLRGHRLNIRISGTLEAIGAGTQFIQGDLYGKLIWPLWTGSRVLVRGELGITGKESIETLPASVRYFAGGDTSVRGYDYKNLGPTDEFGLVTGGSNLLVGSFELEQKLFGNWALAAFVDAGNAFEDFSDFTVEVGVGAGLRWFSPLGPIRLDVAVPLANDAPDDYRLHITLGPDL